jgi:hypothetical protein
MADALLVFTPLQGVCLFVCALSILISIDVTPLLRRRLYGLQPNRFALTFARVSAPGCWLVPQYASSLRLFFYALCAAHPFRQPSHLTYKPSALTFLWRSLLVCFSLLRRVASYLPFEFDVALVSLRAIYPALGLPSSEYQAVLSPCSESTKQFQPSLTLLCIFFDKELGDLSRTRHPS